MTLFCIISIISCKKDKDELPVPEITTFSPTSGTVGTAVTITGENFGAKIADNQVKFGSVTATINFANNKQIKAEVPEGTETGKITVRVGEQMATSSSNFTVVPIASPSVSITSFTPASGRVGTEVTIVGENFGETVAENEVRFGDDLATISSLDEDQLVVSVPQGAETGKILVTVGQQNAESIEDFTVIPPPTISGFDQNAGKPGDQITITGEHFSTTLEDNIVTFPEDVTATVISASETELVVEVPENTSTGPISVSIQGNVGTSTEDFTLIPAGFEEQLAKVLAGDGGIDDEFGYSVAMDGDYAVIGALKNNAAYIYKRSGVHWSEVQKLTGNQSEDRFGVDVDIDDNYIIIGAYLNDTNSKAEAGAAYIFKKSEGDVWNQIQKINADDPANQDYFGISVGISGDKAIVGATGDDDLGSESGSAYIFEKNEETWSQIQKLNGIDTKSDEYFGRSVSIDTDYAVVGAHWHDGNGGTNSGAAYIFKLESGAWNQKQKLSPSLANDNFGKSVDISGSFIIVGARLSDEHGSSSGSAFVFQINSEIWEQQTKLIASDAEGGDFFGVSVSISGNYAVVGSYGNDDDGANSGSAYVFENIGGIWTEQQKLLAADGAAGDEFGTSVSINGNYICVGSALDADNGEDSGSVYFY